MSEIENTDHVEEGQEHQEGTCEIHILALKSLDEHGPGRLQRKHDRNDFRARDDRRQDRPDIGNEEVERHAQRVFHERAKWVKALGAGGHDILFLHLVEQVGAKPPDHAGRPRRSDDDHRYPEMREDRTRLFPAHRLVEVSLIHQMPDRNPEPDIGEVHQDQSQHEVRDGDAEKTEKGQPVVSPTVLMGRRIDADRKAISQVTRIVEKETSIVNHSRSPTTSETGSWYSNE